jgi:hypothetical protein
MENFTKILPCEKCVINLFCLRMHTLVKHAYSARLKYSKHAKMYAFNKKK